MEHVLLFGSLAEDRATVFSDADIMIIVESSDKRFINRPMACRKYFNDLSVDADLLVYTRREIENTPYTDVISGEDGSRELLIADR